MKLGQNQKILVLSPHTDDGEFGLGASISKLIRDGHEVYHVAFSSAANIIEHGTQNNRLVEEIKLASQDLGLHKNRLFIHHFQVRKFHETRQMILDLLLHYKTRVQPDIVFIPSGHDIHQDHQVIHEESLRAFKHQTIFGYELAWNLYKFNYQLFIHVEEIDIANKIAAISQYTSQSHRNYASAEYIESLAICHGVQANTKYAEAFEVIRINAK
jgi:LmbE family N-acetylglucosaminyl deacetylase